MSLNEISKDYEEKKLVLLQKMAVEPNTFKQSLLGLQKVMLDKDLDLELWLDNSLLGVMGRYI